MRKIVGSSAVSFTAIRMSSWGMCLRKLGFVTPVNFSLREQDLVAGLNSTSYIESEYVPTKNVTFWLLAWVEGSILFSKCCFYFSVIYLVLFNLWMILFFQSRKILMLKKKKKKIRRGSTYSIPFRAIDRGVTANLEKLKFHQVFCFCFALESHVYTYIFKYFLLSK